MPVRNLLPHKIIIVIALACLMLVGLAAWRDWVAYQEQRLETSTSLVNLAMSLSQNAEDTMEMADTALLGIVERLENDGRSPTSLARLTRFLVNQVAALPRVQDFIVYGEDGSWLATSMSLKGGNNGDRQYFSHHRDDPSRQLYIGPPILSRANGRWTVTVSRRVQHADGSFAGIALAMIDVAYFTRRYETYDLGADQAIALVTTDGTLLARSPAIVGALGANFSNGDVFTELKRKSAGSLESTAILDGVRRITGFRRSDRYPLVVWAAMSTNNAFAAWQRDAVSHLAIAGVMVTVVGFLGSILVRQVWQRQSIEDQLRESETRYRLLTESSADLIALQPRTGRNPTYVSSASRAVVGFDPEEIASLPAWLTVHPDDLEHNEADQRRLSTSNPRVSNVHRVRHKQGHWVWVESSYQLANPGLPGESVVVRVRDVTEKRQTEADQVQRERVLTEANTALAEVARQFREERDTAERVSGAKTRFLAGMSHELRTPLHGILGYAQLLHSDGGLTPKQASRVDAMLNAGPHLLGLINGVLDMSLIEAERVNLRSDAVTLSSLATACIDLIRPAAAAKGLLLNLAIAANVPAQITADLTRLRQILINLLGNAVKFTQSGEVSLKLGLSTPGPAGGAVILSIEVIDTGMGISKPLQALLFQDFERSDNETVRGIEGAGLGLALSSRLAILMGGRLSHEDNLGGGSVFRLELPLVPDGDAPWQPLIAPVDGVSPAPPAIGSDRALRILVADDLDINRDIARSFLVAEKHEVVCVGGGLEAVRAASDADFDVVLMDVRMPDVDGLEATRRIRALPGRRGRVPIVAVTAQVFAEQITHCREAGMGHHLAKPFVPAELLRVVLSATQTPPDDA